MKYFVTVAYDLREPEECIRALHLHFKGCCKKATKQNEK